MVLLEPSLSQLSLITQEDRVCTEGEYYLADWQFCITCFSKGHYFSMQTLPCL